MEQDRPIELAASRGWSPAPPTGAIVLDLSAADDRTVRNLSAATLHGDTLFIAADEKLSIERLVRGPDGDFGQHSRVSLVALLELNDEDDEADIEGLAVDGDWLWVVGSHGRTRPKPSKSGDDTIDLAALADLKDTRSRCVVARVPLVAPDTGGGWMPVAVDGKRRAGLVKQTKRGNALSAALADDPLIGPFTCLPAKEGGLDIEGIAVAGIRVALGLRGPTLCGHAVLLECRIEGRKSGKLKAELPPFVRLMDLEGLAVRDLKRDGDDLLILAGPTTAVSGPCALFRWGDWLNDLPSDRAQVRLHRPTHVMDLPHGRGFDHPEGLALDGTGPSFGNARLIVLVDSPADERVDGLKLRVDRFDLEGSGPR